jgi:hypothetical protein
MTWPSGSRLAARELNFAIVTDPDGRLLGVVRRNDLEQTQRAS